MNIKGVALYPVRLTDKWYNPGDKIEEDIPESQYKQVKHCFEIETPKIGKPRKDEI